MTQNEISKVLQAIDETKKMITKEGSYSLRLQDENKLANLNSHLSGLRNRLEQNALATYLAA